MQETINNDVIKMPNACSSVFMYVKVSIRSSYELDQKKTAV